MDSVGSMYMLLQYILQGGSDIGRGAMVADADVLPLAEVEALPLEEAEVPS